MNEFHIAINELARQSFLGFITIFLISMVWAFNTAALIAVGACRAYFFVTPKVTPVIKKHWRITAGYSAGMLMLLAYIGFCLGLAAGVSSPIEEGQWLFYALGGVVLIVLGFVWAQDRWIQKKGAKSWPATTYYTEEEDNDFFSNNAASEMLQWSEDRCCNCGRRLTLGEEEVGICCNCAIMDMSYCPACGAPGAFRDWGGVLNLNEIWHVKNEGWSCGECSDK